MANEARARIDEEIAKHTLFIRDLRSRRNTLSPICRLPPELLATILIHCALDYHSNLHFPTRGVPSWVNVSYVCRHWRGVALDCPTLWTYHFMVSLRWTKELLARSKQASLKIRTSFGYLQTNSWRFSLVEKLMNHAERIQELHLDLPNNCTDQIFSRLSSRAPRLQNLKISAEGYPSEWSSVLFHGDTPALRTLELSYCPVPWYSFKLNGLTTLSLDNVPVRFQQSMGEFLATLGSMRNLIHLYLDHALASAAGFLSSAAFHTFQKINLPHLSRLLVVAPLRTATALLSCVNIPSKTEVRLECDSEPDLSLDDYALLSSVLAQRFSMSEDRALSSPTVRSLVIKRAIWGEATLVFSSLERDCDSFDHRSHQYWGCNIPLMIIVDWSHSMMTMEGDRIISDICCSMPLTNVQSVHAIHPPFSPAFWRKTLRHLQGLRYIKLSQGDMPDLASELSLTAHEDVENQSGHATSDRDTDHILAPGLEELNLHEIIFSPEGDSDLLEPAITQRCLLDALSTRNAPQVRLTMTRCMIDKPGVLDMARPRDGGDIYVVSESDSGSSHSTYEEDGSDDD